MGRASQDSAGRKVANACPFPGHPVNSRCCSLQALFPLRRSYIWDYIPSFANSNNKASLNFLLLIIIKFCVHMRMHIPHSRSSGITDVNHNIWLFTWTLEIKFRLSSLYVQWASFTCWAISWPLLRYPACPELYHDSCSLVLSSLKLPLLSVASSHHHPPSTHLVCCSESNPFQSLLAMQ